MIQIITTFGLLFNQPIFPSGGGFPVGLASEKPLGLAAADDFPVTKPKVSKQGTQMTLNN